ncbi:MAG: crossover junction endodeoxyribonuclease RuvC [Parcubacteria group bacterium]|nr:crossover junction endodeoxyribonuclease RuvC [Parcubacteria group bacterium]
MRIIAIDPGFERVGVAVLEKSAGKEVLIFSDCIRTNPKDVFEERLRVIGTAFGKLVETYAPEVLAIETLLFNTNQKTAMKVAEGRGTIVFKAKEAGLHVEEYTPLQIKVAITGWGRAPKEQVTLMVKQLLRVPEKKGRLDDEYDAIAVGLTHFATEKTRSLS